jgi:hypothetical protein
MDSYISNANGQMDDSNNVAHFTQAANADSGYFGEEQDDWFGNASFLATGSLDEALAFYHVTNTGALFGGATDPVQVTRQEGLWTLAANGELRYEVGAVVPVPAAVWLLGSAMIGLVGVSRRRQQA